MVFFFNKITITFGSFENAEKNEFKKGVSNLFTFKIPGFDWFDIGYTSFFSCTNYFHL